MKFNVRFLQQGTDNGCLQCDVTYKTLSPEPRQTLSGFRHQLSALEIHCESQAMAAWGTLRPWEQRGQWNPQKCPESKVQSSYPPILICIDNDIQRHYPLCPLYSFPTGYTEIHEMFWETRFIHIFGTHSFDQDTGLMRNAEEGQKATWTGRLHFPRSWPLSQHRVSSVCVNMGNTYEGVTSGAGGQ